MAELRLELSTIWTIPLTHLPEMLSMLRTKWLLTCISHNSAVQCMQSALFSRFVFHWVHGSGVRSNACKDDGAVFKPMFKIHIPRKPSLTLALPVLIHLYLSIYFIRSIADTKYCWFSCSLDLLTLLCFRLCLELLPIVSNSNATNFTYTLIPQSKQACLQSPLSNFYNSSFYPDTSELSLIFSFPDWYLLSGTNDHWILYFHPFLPSIIAPSQSTALPTHLWTLVL